MPTTTVMDNIKLAYKLFSRGYIRTDILISSMNIPQQKRCE